MNKPVFPGKFEVQGEIAQGKTGTIYYGYDLELRQEVAIKIYHSHINGRLIRGKPFIEKASPLLKLDHPNLIKIFKVEEDDGTPVVFMEFFDGPSLQQVIQENGPLSVEHMLILSRGIAEVLVHTHFQGIIHGTLHPGHVLVGPQQHIKVMDLGLSWILMDILSNCDEDLLRPLHYLPPESARSEFLSLSSDLYALGFMMYEMLTRTTPYTDLPKTSIMGKLAFDQSDPSFHFPDSVPEGVRDLIRQLTRNDPQKRLKDATHALTIINQLLAKLNPTTLQTTPITGASRKPIQPDASQKIDIPQPATSTVTQTQEAASPPIASELPQPPGIQRPSTQVNYLNKGRSTSKRYAGLVGGIIALMIIGGSIGYWFRDSVEQLKPPFSIPISEEKSHEQSSLPEIPTPRSMELPVNTVIPVRKESTDFPQHALPNTNPQAPLQSEKQPVQQPAERNLNGEIISHGERPSALPAKPSTPAIQAPPDQVPQDLKLPPATSPMINQTTQDVIVKEGKPLTTPTNLPIPPTETPPSQPTAHSEIPPMSSPAIAQPTKEVSVEEKFRPNLPAKTPTSLKPVSEKTENGAPVITPLPAPTIHPLSSTQNSEAKTGVSTQVEGNAQKPDKPSIAEPDLLHDPATQELLDAIDATDDIPFPSDETKVADPQKP
ncbi:MAG: protein kinase [Nitrospirales bacterium]|nr:protein kinase [Nitrospirales bacterium]